MGNATDPRRLALAAAKALDDKKAVDVRVLKVHDLTVLTDYFVIVRHLPAHTLYGSPLLGCLKAGIKQEHIPVTVQQLTIGSYHPPVVA